MMSNFMSIRNFHIFLSIVAYNNDITQKSVFVLDSILKGTVPETSNVSL